MDLESECSVPVEDNEIVTHVRSIIVEGERIETNGSCGGERGDDKLASDSKVRDDVITQPAISPQLTVKSSAGRAGLSPPSLTKGYGLKKWRRIKREVTKDSNSSLDISRMLKRGLSTSATTSARPQDLKAEMKKKSESSLSSTNAVVKSMGIVSGGFALQGSSLISNLPGNFAAGTDSENSEDRSSRSSTAASVPKSKYDLLVSSARNKNGAKSWGGKNLGKAVQQGQQGKNRIESTKKLRGERGKVEKENSVSSVESDSRSSNFVFLQGTNSVTSNGRRSGRSTKYVENGNDADGGERNLSEELQTGTGYIKENLGEFGHLLREDMAAGLSWEAKEEEVENHTSSAFVDPLIESIVTLQSAQEALEKEVEKFREIGHDEISLCDGSTQGSSSPTGLGSTEPTKREANSSDPVHSAESKPISPHSAETQVINLQRNASLLESKLEEANAALKEKEAKIIGLEYILSSRDPSKEHKGQREMETEAEGLFRQKLEAEVEYLAISRSVQKLRVAVMDQISLFEEQKALALEQAQLVNELGDVQIKAGMLKEQAEKLETYCEGIVEADDALKLQKRICKVTSYFFIQLIMLVGFALFFEQFLPHNSGDVPT
ncbi:hypothetical protein NMG60_11037473 [Bertholletia excelsa]